MSMLNSEEFSAVLGMPRGTFGRKLKEHRAAVDSGQLPGPHIEPDDVKDHRSHRIHLYKPERATEVLKAFEDLSKLKKN